LTDEFLKRAHDIRNKYFPETRGSLQRNVSHYNAKKIVGVCEYCKKNLGEEVHHLEQQKHADANGYIGTFHKNHPANLLTVCEECHLKLHNTEETPVPKMRKKTSRGYSLMNVSP
jgi:DNA mismatch repair protein MutS